MRRVLMLATFLLVIAGCGRRDSAGRNDESKAPAGVPAVTIVHPEKKAIKHVVEQPGFNVEAYQEAPLYSRISGYVKKWHRDIGDSVKKDEVLADLYVPEMEVDVKQKEAAVKYATAQIDQAKAPCSLPGHIWTGSNRQRTPRRRLSRCSTRNRWTVPAELWAAGHDGKAAADEAASEAGLGEGIATTHHPR